MSTNSILSGFPSIKRSYENIIHKKVYDADLIFAIPMGRKCFAWFTERDDKPICYIIETLENGQLSVVGNFNCCFNRDLSYGTILYGTFFYHKNNNYFTIEDIFHYKGRDLTRSTWGEKYNLISNILAREMKPVSYNKSFVVFGAPLVSNTVDSILKLISGVQYKIYTIQFRTFTNSNHFNYIRYVDLIRINQTRDPQNHQTSSHHQTSSQIQERRPAIRQDKNRSAYREMVFCVKPDIQNDVYHLFCSNNELYEYACIPDFKTSVMMNQLFRNIKENANLDALEESDDEEEFENDKKDRFVFLDKAYNMVCAYNPKFKKWYPLRVADNTVKIVNRSELVSLENNKR